ncbi:MAG: GNAT family N-acetyltransferase [Verrucomicrobiota bacterium]
MPANRAPLTVERYSPARKTDWDAFVAAGRNSTFLFRRDYMDYHSDRFRDCSLMVFDGAALIAVMPANDAGQGTVTSHGGLTYGGLVIGREATLMDVLASFQAILRWLHDNGHARLLFKQIPAFYNSLPDDEVDCALFQLDARLYRRDCAITVRLADRLPLQKRRQRSIKKAEKAGLRIVQEATFDAFWDRVLVPRLAGRYGVKPVHSVQEITLLASRFPDNIRLFAAYRGDEILAGTVIYETPAVAHAQYIATTDAGQESGALDYLFQQLIDVQYRNKTWFDFGNCSEKDGRALNYGLLDWKEGFGGRCVAHDFYEIETVRHVKLEALINPTPEKL